MGYLYALHDEIDNSIYDEWNAFFVAPWNKNTIMTKMSNEMD